MPEALALVLVVSLIGGLLLATWVQARQAAHRQPAQELARLQQHLAWLEERSRHAEENHWGDDMKQRHATELARTQARLAETQARLESAADRKR